MSTTEPRYEFARSQLSTAIWALKLGIEFTERIRTSTNAADAVPWLLEQIPDRNPTAIASIAGMMTTAVHVDEARQTLRELELLRELGLELDQQ